MSARSILSRLFRPRTRKVATAADFDIVWRREDYLRKDPGADWVDPVEASPYRIEKPPMFVCDVPGHRSAP